VPPPKSLATRAPNISKYRALVRKVSDSDHGNDGNYRKPGRELHSLDVDDEDDSKAMDEYQAEAYKMDDEEGVDYYDYADVDSEVGDEYGSEEDDDDETPQRELEYLEAIEEHLAKPAVQFAPQTFTPDSLIINRVATAAGQMGPISEIDEVTGRLARRDDTRWASDADLARKLMQGQLVKFRDVEEKRRVMVLAEEWAGQTANKVQERLGRPVETEHVGFVPVDADVREILTDKVVRGYYGDSPEVVAGEGLKESSIAHMAKAVQMNGSYSPTAGKSMLDFVEQMWPTESPNARAGK